MSFLLVTVAVVVAAICVPTAAGMTAMALSGGDGEAQSWFHGVLAAIVAFGSMYNVLASFAAYWGLDGWRWWAMLLAPAAGLLGVVTVRDTGKTTPSEWAVGVALQLAIALPPTLLLVSDRVSV